MDLAVDGDSVDPAAISDQMDIGFSGRGMNGRYIAKSDGTISQRTPHRQHGSRADRQWGAGIRRPAAQAGVYMKFRMQHQRKAGIAEKGPVAGIQIGFGFDAFRDQHRMPVEFDVVVFNRLQLGVMNDRHVVDEKLRRDQLAVDEHAVRLRNQQVARRQPVSHCATLDADRRQAGRLAVPVQVKPAVADPFHRLANALTVDDRNHLVTSGNSLNRNFTAGRQDARAGSKANSVAEEQFVPPLPSAA